MKLYEIKGIRRVLPYEMPFGYFADRESPWLLTQMIDGTASVASLHKSVAGKLLSRPLVQPLVAGCGGKLAHPQHAGNMARLS